MADSPSSSREEERPAAARARFFVLPRHTQSFPARLFTFFALFVVLLAAPAAVTYHAERSRIPSEWSVFAPLDLTAPSTPVQRWKIAGAMADGGLCRAAIAAAGLRAAPRDDMIRDAHCSLIDSVALEGLEAMRLASVNLRCPVAMSLFLWEREAVQPAARRHFGEPVARLLHFGGYSCRKIAGSWFWSRHATGDAIDVSGFQLKSGRVISVKKHWSAGGAEAAFLREARDGACGRFDVVLSPDYNAAHHDHFHLDLGWWRRCG